MGIGSPFGDDKAGWLVVDKLKQNPAIAKLVENGCLQLEVADRPGINLINWLLDEYERIVLIDMVKTNLQVSGTVYNLKASDIIGFSGMLSSHSLGVSASLALARELGISIDNVEFWGIEGSNIKPDTDVSQSVLTVIAEVSQKIFITLSLNI